jgi:hypothetical protein
MSNDVTSTKWAVTWLSASGRFESNGETTRAYGKDVNGYLVAIRTDSGDRPVHNLAAVIAHRQDV